RLALSACAYRDRPRLVHHHPDCEHALAAAHLGHGTERASADDGREPCGGRSVTGDTLRKLLSSAFVGACALSVLLALVPLAFVLFFVVSQGIGAFNVEF